MTPACRPKPNQTLIAGAIRSCGGGCGSVRRPAARLGLGASALRASSAERVPSKRRSCRRRPTTRYNPQASLDPEFGHRSGAGIPAAVPPEAADPEPELGVDLQRHDSAEARDGTLRRADPVPALPTGCRPTSGRTAASGATRSRTHEHNGHHGAENDGFTGAFFFPDQFYDYHWPIVLAGIQHASTPPRPIPGPRTPDDSGGKINIPGDWRETMSTHWFHDHMFSFTSQNVYKGNAAMFNIYSALDRGNEAINDGVNLRLPSGTAEVVRQPRVRRQPDARRQGAGTQTASSPSTSSTSTASSATVMTVNLAYKPFFEVERRKYRFRILNAQRRRASSRSRSLGRLAADRSRSRNDGNLLPAPGAAHAARRAGHRRALRHRHRLLAATASADKSALVNLAEHQDGKRLAEDLIDRRGALGQFVTIRASGQFLEFRIVRNPATARPRARCRRS